MEDSLLSRDAILGGRCFVWQPRRGYRFSIDAVCLAFFAKAEPGRAAADLGTGCGVIPLILAHRFPDLKVYGVEKQAALASLAERNFAENGLSDRLRAVAGDFRDLPFEPLAGPLGLVLCNPPFHPPGTGRLSPDAQRAAARHELFGGLPEAAAAAARLLGEGGLFCSVYPASRRGDCLRVFTETGLAPVRLRLVHARAGREPELVLACGKKGYSGECAEERPLVLYEAPGIYGPEAAAMFKGEEWDEGGPGSQ